MTTPGPLRVAVLISGRGTNMAAIAEAARSGRIPARVVAVLSDRSEAEGLARAKALDIPAQVVVPRPGQAREDYDRELLAALRAHSPGLVVLAGFMRILGAEFVHSFEGRLLNIHPSLLPKYPGLRTHERALVAGDRDHGASVHFVTEELDGGPVVIQGRVPILPGDDPDRLAARVHVQEHRIYPQAIAWFASGRLRWHEGKPWLDGKPVERPVILDSTEAP
jgi:phosphoribosylglycinamide formyltransferase-1